MSFRITARTILHLGSDLISSDAVAIYELVKNAIDAKSQNGVDVAFDIVIRQADFAAAIAFLDETATTLEQAKQKTLSLINEQADADLKETFRNAIRGARSKQALRASAIEVYRDTNRIRISDTGHGMSRSDLSEIFLTIGTISRARAVRVALGEGAGAPPYLGEKGVGRLSTMRLGWKLRVETVTEAESRTNILEIDWRKFEEADDAEASSVVLKPTAGGLKGSEKSFTRITISDLRSSWSLSRLTQVANEQIARITDPFSWAGRRFQIRLEINGAPVQPVRAVVKELLANAHAKCEGQFSLEDGKPLLTARVESALYAGTLKRFRFDLTDLMSMSGLRESGLPSSVLRTLGPFTFEMYWFNRQRIRALPDVGDRETVRKLQKQWAGICLFRDGYRVLPYGDDGDDWLGLDLTALASSGYKLNTKQIIGRVSIGRITNPRLVDQTNRQGLLETPEKEVLIGLLRQLISRWWHDYLNEALNAQQREERVSYDPKEEESVVDALELRARQSIRQIRGQYTGEQQLLRNVQDAFLEIKEAHQKAVQRILTIEEEKERLTQLAGVGLMTEVIAHELTRATELTQATLKDLSRRRIDDDGASAALHTLNQQIRVIQQRLQVLEPLSVTARMRRSRQNLNKIVANVLNGHHAQFRRHFVSYRFSDRSDVDVFAFVIEGNLVQILENLINNSIYWLDLERKERPSFAPEIRIRISQSPLGLVFSDNGPGIPRSRAESVFEPFFSTKSGNKSRRQGLGLYIARQNAESLGGSLSLARLGHPHQDRYNTFLLSLKEGPNEP